MNKSLNYPTARGRYELSHRLFVMAPHKAGSTMLFNYCRDICRLLDVKHVSFPDAVWGAGGDLKQFCYEPPDANGVYADKIVYLGNREAIRSLSAQLVSVSHVLLMIRDPRDCLVSRYFSFLGSHAAPSHLSAEQKSVWMQAMTELQEKVDIDTYALDRAPGYLHNMQQMIAFTKASRRGVIIRYEDYIKDKLGLCRRVCAILDELKLHRASLLGRVASSAILKPLSQSRRNAALSRIASLHDILPQTEDLGSHVRHARPGDHLAKLRRDTINRLDAIFEPILREFSY
jgi:hypothetical protein